MKTVFANSMLTHVWAQGNQAEGRSQNGNLFFEGARLYSYGRHYIAGFLLPDGRALLNASRYSVSTSRHVTTAARATRRASEYLENLTEFARLMERAEDIETFARTPAEAKQARAEVFKAAESMVSGTGPKRLKESRRAGFCNVRAAELEPLNPAALGWVLEYIAPGLSAEKARAYADSWVSKRLANCQAWKQAGRAEIAAADLARARAYAKTPLTQTAETLAEVPKRHYFSAEGAAKVWAETGKAIFRGVKAARAAGFNVMAEKARGHYNLIRAALPLWPDLEAKTRARELTRARVSEYRAALKIETMAATMTAEALAEKTRDSEVLASVAFGASRVSAAGVSALWASDNGGRNLAETMTAGIRAARFLASALNPDQDSGFPQWNATEAGRVMRAVGFKWPSAELAFLTRAESWERICKLSNQTAERARNRQTVKTLRAFKAAEAIAAAGGSGVPVTLAREARGAAQTRVYGSAGPFKIAGFTSESFRAIVTRAEAIEREAARMAALERAAAEKRKAAEALASWRAGGPRLGNLSDDKGGALLRVRGQNLETSWGAEVPLSHAIRVFRFLIKCRAENKGWAANGKTLPVGLFRVDSVSASGGFVAGCHKVNWPEIEAAAIAAGVSDLAPADTTEARAYA